MEDTDEISPHEVIYAMRHYGGGFVKALGTAWLHADAENFAKLQAAFPEYWAKYTEVARLHRTHMAQE